MRSQIHVYMFLIFLFQKTLWQRIVLTTTVVIMLFQLTFSSFPLASALSVKFSELKLTSGSLTARSPLTTGPENEWLSQIRLMKLAAVRISGPSGIFEEKIRTIKQILFFSKFVLFWLLHDLRKFAVVVTGRVQSSTADLVTFTLNFFLVGDKLQKKKKHKQLPKVLNIKIHFYNVLVWVSKLSNVTEGRFTVPKYFKITYTVFLIFLLKTIRV